MLKIFSFRSISPSLQELKVFSKQLERRMSKLNIVENEDTLPNINAKMRSLSNDKVFSHLISYEALSFMA